MLPRYFHYIEPADPLNSVLDRFMRGKPLTEPDLSLLKKHATEKNPTDDRIRRIARALLALATDRKTTYDYPLTQSLRRLRLRVTREREATGRTRDRGSELTR
jgi:hypothetical protein